MYLSAKEKEEEQRAVLERQKHLEEILRRRKEMEAKTQTESITDQEMVDSIFDFLPGMVGGGQEGQAPVGYEVWEAEAWHLLWFPSSPLLHARLYAFRNLRGESQRR